jgi:glycosyltransferase involved in cell wall biosynthesis
VLLIGPVPPPHFGVAKAKRLMLDSSVLAERVRLIHLDTSDIRGLANIGKFDWHNALLGVRHVCRLVRLLATEHPDIAMLTASQGRFGLLRDAIFVRLARLFRSKVVVHLRGSGYAGLRETEGRCAAHDLRVILKHSSLVIVLGNSLVDMAHSVYPQSQVAVIPNGCPPATRPELVGRRDEGRPLLAYIGLLGPAKGLEEALKAARTVADVVPTLQFVLCGEWESPQYKAKVLQLVEELGITGIVRFPGPIAGEEKEALLGRAWVLVVPSHSEGHPWVIIEAMSAGLPVVATDTGAIAETVEDGATGFVVPIGDVDAMAMCITTLLRDDAIWKRMSEASVCRHRALFTVERSHSLLADELCRVAHEK